MATKYDYDFSGWATKNDLKCGDGRTIKRDAFIDNDGHTVPLVWNHQHADAANVLGHALLENREEGVYAYCSFNDTENGQIAKDLVKHGDVHSLSIYANKLKQNGGDVLHGIIREVSLVLAGANPGAQIDSVMAHGEFSDEEAFIQTGVPLSIESGSLEHAEKPEPAKKEENKMPEKSKTVGEVFETLSDEQKTVVYALIGAALEEDKDASKNEEDKMKHNVFENDNLNEQTTLCHADGVAIVDMAKNRSIGTLKNAIELFEEDNSLQHDAFSNMTQLFPDYKLIDPAEPKVMWDDDSWFDFVLNGVHKSPISRIRTRRADARKAELSDPLKAKGYTKGSQKSLMGKINLLGRTHDAQTIYIKDKLERDDILDITDFDIVSYEWKLMRHALNETIATAILFGDGRTDLDPDKIKETHIRPIYHDDDFYCIHKDVDFAAAKTKIQGTNTSANFSDNYIMSEAIIEAALYAKEKYKGSGSLVFLCTPHLLNVMMLARDLNGRRIYSSKSDLAAALDVREIRTIEQMDGQTRVDANSKTHKLLGLFVNMGDYQLGCVKGGQITSFEQFDIDFNQQKMLLETRVSGALVEPYSAIALEELVTTTNTPATNSSTDGE